MRGTGSGVTASLFSSAAPARRASRRTLRGTGPDTAEIEAAPINIRTKRYSPYPRNKKLSKLAAQQVKEAEEKKLNAGVVRAKAAEVKEASIVRFGAVTAKYRHRRSRAPGRRVRSLAVSDPRRRARGRARARGASLARVSRHCRAGRTCRRSARA